MGWGAGIGGSLKHLRVGTLSLNLFAIVSSVDIGVPNFLVQRHGWHIGVAGEAPTEC